MIIYQTSQGVCSDLSLSCCTDLVISHSYSFRLWSLAETIRQISSLSGLSFTPPSTNQITYLIGVLKSSCSPLLLLPSCNLILQFFQFLSSFQTQVFLSFQINGRYFWAKLLMLNPFASAHWQLIPPIQNFGKDLNFVLDSLKFSYLKLAYQVTLWKVNFCRLRQHQWRTFVSDLILCKVLSFSTFYFEHYSCWDCLSLAEGCLG